MMAGLQYPRLSATLLMLALLCSNWTSQLALQSFTDFVYGDCSNGPSNNDTLNVLQVMLALQNASSTALYGQRLEMNMYGIYQCRGDLTLEQCANCVSAIVSKPYCDPKSLGMRMILEGCYLRYKNSNFPAYPDFSLVTGNCSSSQILASSSGLGDNLGIVLNRTAQTAPSSRGYFWSDRQGSGTNTAYALAQCVGYISSSQCSTCLSQVSNFSTVCKNSIAGQVYFGSCYYVYNNSPILFNSRSATAIRAPAPLPSWASGAHQHSGATSGKKRTSPLIPVAAAVAGVILVLAAAVVALLLWRIGTRKQKRRRGNQTDRFNTREESLQLSLSNHFRRNARKFTIHELQEATSNFDPRYKLGEGGFGPVYKGCLKSGREVAIKVLSYESHQGVSEFSSEINLISTIQHRNLIQLLGYCAEGSQRLLVYEYLPNRSLDMLLFAGSDQSRPTLEWRARFNIIIGIAQGLSYLHEDCDFKIVHRDIKASNILLDSKFSPKVADFGLARLFPNDVTHITTRVAGTLGYLAPEYAVNGWLTEKADVYSFGVLVLEIVSGRRIKDHSLPPEQLHLLEWAWALFQRSQQIELLDKKLGRSSETADEVVRVVHVALLCTQTFPISRPSISNVSAMLLGQSVIFDLPSKPGFYESQANSSGPISSR